MSKHTFRIGSHDTMTYAQPESWYLRPFHFVARTQSLDYKTQYNDYGICMFDLRIRWSDKDNCWKFAHGAMTFKTEPVEEVFKWLNARKDCYIRLVLEYNKPVKDIEEISARFVEDCDRWVDIYRNAVWFEFTRKYDWKRLYSYDGMPHPDYYQAISSMTSFWSWKLPWLDDWYPKLYAKSQNRDNLEQGTSHDWLFMDFVEIR